MKKLYGVVSWGAIVTFQLTYSVLNQTADFGKKHFIVGYKPHNHYVQQQRDAHKISRKITESHGQIKTVLFAPNDDLRETLLHLIDQEQEHIAIAMFSFTDKDFAQALAQAYARGVEVEIVVDPSNVYGRYSKLNILKYGQVNVFIYNPRRFNQSIPGIMHNKFAIFKKNIQNKSLIWTGSFNFTRAAHQRNQENVIVLDDALIIQQFTQQFQELKKYADVYRTPIAAYQMTKK